MHIPNFFIKKFSTLITIALCLTFSWQTLNARTFIVKNLTDGAPGSLREALLTATSGDTIRFQHPLSGSIVLQKPLPLISTNLTIQGNGQVAIDGQHLFQVLFVNSGNVSISDLAILNGFSQGGNGGTSFSGNGGGGLGAGGGLFVNNGAVVILTNVNFKYNVAKGGDGGCLDNIYQCGAGGGGGGGMNGGCGGDGSFNFNSGSGGGGGGGFFCQGGSCFSAGGGGGGFTGAIRGHLIFGNGNHASLLAGGNGGNGFGGINTGGHGGVNNAPNIDGQPGNPISGGGGGGGGSGNAHLNGGKGAIGGAIGGGGGGGGGEFGGKGGNGGAFGGGGGGGGSTSACDLACAAPGGMGGFGGGGGGGGGCGCDTDFGGVGGNGGFGGGGGGGGKNAHGGFSLKGGGAGGANGGGGGGGAGYGGAIFVRECGVLVLKNVTFSRNKVIGGSGCDGGTNGEAAGVDVYFVELEASEKRGEISMIGNGVIKNPLAGNQNGKISVNQENGKLTINGFTQGEDTIIDEATFFGDDAYLGASESHIDLLIENLNSGI